MSGSARVALVTGGSRRVGRAIVRRLASAGFDVVFTYFNSIDLAGELVQELRSAGRRAAAVRADLGEPDDAVNAIAGAFNFDRLDVLVNNASVYEPSDLQTFTAAQSRRLWAVHVEGPLLLCRYFEKHLRDSRGHVINMVDLLAERPWPQYLVYCASKAALANLTAGLARELAPEVTVNGIAPGVVEWPDEFPEDLKAAYLKRVPLRRPGTAEDAAEAVHYLCTTGTYITGQIIRLDGGRSIT